MEDYLSKYELKNKFSYLPLVHTTKLMTFKTIFKSNQLEPVKKDEVTNDELLFFFYGRAVYTTHWDGNKKRNSLSNKEIPLAFIFEVKDMPKPDYIFPFDSGGFENEKYKNTYVGACEIENIESFKLNDYIDIKKILDLFYPNKQGYNKNYSYINEITKNRLDYHNEILNKYLTCIKEGTDRKNKTPEISMKEKVSLSNCKAIIVPVTVLEMGAFKKEFEYIKNEYNTRIIEYYDYGNNDSLSLCQAIEREMNRYIKEKEYFTK